MRASRSLRPWGRQRTGELASGDLGEWYVNVLVSRAARLQVLGGSRTAGVVDVAVEAMGWLGLLVTAAVILLDLAQLAGQ